MPDEVRVEIPTDKRYWPDPVVFTWFDSRVMGETAYTKFETQSLDKQGVQSTGWLISHDDRNVVIARDMWIDNDQMVFRGILIVPVQALELKPNLLTGANKDQQRQTWR